MNIKNFYDKWCKDTKRNGGVLVHSSIWELMYALYDKIVPKVDGLPKRDFIIPNDGAGTCNKDAFICSNCDRVIAQENFYICPNRQCMVGIKWTAEQLKSLGERCEKDREIQSLKQELKKYKNETKSA